MSRVDHWIRFIAIGICALWWLGSVVLPGDWRNTVQVGLAFSIAIGAVLVSVGGLAVVGVRTTMRKRNVRRNPLDPSLRPLVMSDVSWENCAQALDFCAAALEAYRFLVEEEGFKPARMDPELRMLTFRRDDIVVNVGEGTTEQGVEALAQVLMVRSSASFEAVAGADFGNRSDGLGENHRGVAFHLKSHLDTIIAGLRTSVSASDQVF